jgi:hypothetical protein
MAGAFHIHGSGPTGRAATLAHGGTYEHGRDLRTRTARGQYACLIDNNSRLKEDILAVLMRSLMGWLRH